LKRILIQTIAILALALFTAVFDTAYAQSSVHTAVREYIEANMPWLPDTVRVDFMSQETESDSLSNDVVLRIEPAKNQDFIGDVIFLAKYFRNGNLVKTQSVRARIEVQRDVVTAARGIPSGTILKEGDIRIVSRWVSRINPQSLDPAEPISGKRLSTQVASGAEILANMVKEAPLVRKGKTVKMVFDNGLMQIVTVGLSEEDGTAGNIIRVRNITSNKIVYARVISDSLVGIEL
jgi:flagellar basal body P-ring formation protein FlgA